MVAKREKKEKKFPWHINEWIEYIYNQNVFTHTVRWIGIVICNFVFIIFLVKVGPIGILVHHGLFCASCLVYTRCFA